MKYVLQIKEGKIEEMNLTEVQEKILQAIVDIAEEEHDFTVYIVNQNITDQLNLKSRATVGKVLNKLVDNKLLIRRSASCYKFNTDYAEFKEVAENKKDTAFNTAKIEVEVSADEFLPVAEWLRDVATAEDNMSYCIAYRTLRDNKNSFTEEEKLVARAYLTDKINRHSTDAIVEKINKTCNNCDLAELIRLIS